MKVLGVDHIGIAVKSLLERVKFYELMGLKSTCTEDIVSQKVRVAFFPVGDSEFELLESTAPDSPIARFIEKNGEGIHHIALRVDDIEAAVAFLEEWGIRFINEKPSYGAGGAKVAFIHPKSTGGILLEISERQ
jgi:methylmalonyl-CoA/ethylmalonyl-CoA epimerase